MANQGFEIGIFFIRLTPCTTNLGLELIKYEVDVSIISRSMAMRTCACPFQLFATLAQSVAEVLQTRRAGLVMMTPWLGVPQDGSAGKWDDHSKLTILLSGQAAAGSTA
jgi:hypothetical protein